MAQLSEVSQKILLALEEKSKDCEWVEYEIFVTEMSILIPPGEALRKAEYNRTYYFKRNNADGELPKEIPSRKRNIDVSDQVRIGQETIIRERISGLAQYNWLEVGKFEGRKAIRLKSKSERVNRGAGITDYNFVKETADAFPSLSEMENWDKTETGVVTYIISENEQVAASVKADRYIHHLNITAQITLPLGMDPEDVERLAVRLRDDVMHGINEASG